MGDLDKIPGANPVGPPPGERGPIKPGTEKFKDLMKVGDSEKRQKKGKKKQDESEEDLKAELRSGAIAPNKEAEAAKKAAKTPKIQQVGETEKREPKKQRRPEEVVPEAAEEIAATNISQAKLSQFKIESDLNDLEKKLDTLAQPVYGQLVPQQEEAGEVAKVEEKEEAVQQVTFKQVAQEKVQQEATQAVFPASSTLGPLFISPATEAAPAYTALNSEILALFEKMVGVISVMKESGITETIIHLNTAEYANSRFAGSEIIIREYSTAPLAYNIELVGTSQNAALFEQNIGALMTAFRAGNHNFTVNRIESRLLQRTDKPLFHRKEKTSEKKEEE
jgi:hypothetical protein